MHLLIDTSAITTDKSGTGVYARGLLKSMLLQDEVRKVTAVGGDLTAESLPNPQKLDHQCAGRTDWHLLLNRDLAGNRPNFTADLALFPNYFMPPAFSIPSLVTIHDLSFLSHPHYYSPKMRAYYRWRVRHSFRHAEAILTVSRQSKAQIEHYFGDYRPKVKIIRPGYNLDNDTESVRQEEIFPALYPSSHQTLLYLGTLEPRKNIISMIEGFWRAKTGNTQLLIVGKLNGTPTYNRKVKRLMSDSENIRYLGYLSDDSVRACLKQADGLVNLSRLEGFGFSVLEAMVRRIPCLISRDPALRELAGGQAISVDASSPTPIAVGFEQLLEMHPSQLNGRTETLQKRATWNRFGDELFSLLDAIREERRPKMKTCTLFSDTVKQAIVDSLAYSAVFEAPIEKDRLYETLGERTDFSTFERCLEDLLDSHPSLIKQEGPFYSLQPWSKSGKEYVTEKQRNAVFIRKYRQVLKIIDRLPWVEGLYFSGGTVHGSQLEERDLDLFVVAEQNRVWLVYSMLKLISKLFFPRSVLCYNYLVDQDALHIHYQQDFFTAHQLISLEKALSDADYPGVLHYNQWVQKYFPNQPLKSKSRNTDEETVAENGTGSLKSDEPGNYADPGPLYRPLNLINLLCMFCYQWVWRMKGLRNRSGGLLWDAHRIKLHTNDHRPWIYKRFHEIMQQVKKRVRKTSTVFDKTEDTGDANNKKETCEK